MACRVNEEFLELLESRGVFSAYPLGGKAERMAYEDRHKNEILIPW